MLRKMRDWLDSFGAKIKKKFLKIYLVGPEIQYSGNYPLNFKGSFQKFQRELKYLLSLLYCLFETAGCTSFIILILLFSLEDEQAKIIVRLRCNMNTIKYIYIISLLALLVQVQMHSTRMNQARSSSDDIINSNNAPRLQCTNDVREVITFKQGFTKAINICIIIYYLLDLLGFFVLLAKHRRANEKCSYEKICNNMNL